MKRMNVEPMATFPDGSQLLISTQYSREGGFACELYLFVPREMEGSDLRVASDRVEAATCREAQQQAYGYAKRLYPHKAGEIKEPPYLVWSGPNQHVAPENLTHWSRRR